jgi:hypothetical protein
MVKRTMGWAAVVAGLAALLLVTAGAGDGASAWDRSRGGFRDHGVHGPRAFPHRGFRGPRVFVGPRFYAYPYYGPYYAPYYA